MGLPLDDLGGGSVHVDLGHPARGRDDTELIDPAARFSFERDPNDFATEFRANLREDVGEWPSLAAFNRDPGAVMIMRRITVVTVRAGWCGREQAGCAKAQDDRCASGREPHHRTLRADA